MKDSEDLRDKFIEDLRDSFVSGFADGYKQGLMEATKWIPVTEQLPEDYGTYICTCFDGYANRVTFVKWQNKLKQWILNGSRSYWKVIAWMPLPEPYEELNGRSK